MAVDAIRTPMTPTAHPRRRLEERLALRFPRAFDAIVRWLARLPHRSKVRQAVIRRVVRTGWEAFNRDDLDAAFTLYHRDCESSFPSEWGTIGVGTTTHGRDERVRYQRDLVESWGRLRFKPQELIDFADGRVLCLGRMKGTGRASGAEVDMEWAAVFTAPDGRVIHERIYPSHAEALEAAGLSE